MCDRLEVLAAAMVDYGRGFDAERLSAGDAEAVVGHAEMIRRVAATLVALAGARVAGVRGGGTSAGRAATGRHAGRTGQSAGAARRDLELGGALREHPEVAAAAAAGELSPEQAGVICDTAQVDRTAAEGLVALAAGGAGMAELCHVAAEIKAASRADDAEAYHRQVHAGRRLRSWVDVDGVWHLRANGTVGDGARIDAALDPLRTERFDAARRAGERDHPDAYGFDALVDLATGSGDHCSPGDVPPPVPSPSGPSAPVGPSAPGGPPAPSGPPAPAVPPPVVSPSDLSPGAASAAGGGQDADGPPPTGTSSTGTSPTDCPPVDDPPGGAGPGSGAPRRRSRVPTKIIFRVDLAAFLRGVTRAGETCEIAGYGPVPVSEVRRALAETNPIVAAVLTDTVGVAGVAHLRRSPTAHQRSALEWLYPTCAAAGCASSAHLEIDHRADWAATHVTVTELLDRLCHWHHQLKTRDGWALVAGFGKRPFVAPSDPRHPVHSRPAAMTVDEPPRDG